MKQARPVMEVDDIPGARPARRQFQKKIYRQKHEAQIKKFKRHQLDLIGDVYLQSRSQKFPDGLPAIFGSLSKSREKFSQNSYSLSASFNPQNYSTGNKPQWKQVDLSQSMPAQMIEDRPQKAKNSQLAQEGYVQNQIKYVYQPKKEMQKGILSQSTVLSASGLKSFISDSIGKNNPYFPQIYGDEKQIFAPGNKMTGVRNWNGQATQSVSLGKGNAAYYPKWGA